MREKGGRGKEGEENGREWEKGTEKTPEGKLRRKVGIKKNPGGKKRGKKKTGKKEKGELERQEEGTVSFGG